MLNITNIESALYTWVFGVLGITTIFDKPNAPRPTTAYALIHIAQTVPQGIAESIETIGADDTVDVDYSNLESLFISINIFRTGGYQNATKLKDSLARVTVTDQLYASGLGYERATGVRDVAAEVNMQWEERGQFDVFFFTRSLDEENIEAIKKIEVTNNINDDGETVIIEHP